MNPCNRREKLKGEQEELLDVAQDQPPPTAKQTDSKYLTFKINFVIIGELIFNYKDY